MSPRSSTNALTMWQDQSRRTIIKDGYHNAKHLRTVTPSSKTAPQARRIYVVVLAARARPPWKGDAQPPHTESGRAQRAPPHRSDFFLCALLRDYSPTLHSDLRSGSPEMSFLSPMTHTPGVTTSCDHRIPPATGTVRIASQLRGHSAATASHVLNEKPRKQCFLLVVCISTKHLRQMSRSPFAPSPTPLPYQYQATRVSWLAEDLGTRLLHVDSPPGSVPLRQSADWKDEGDKSNPAGNRELMLSSARRRLTGKPVF